MFLLVSRCVYSVPVWIRRLVLILSDLWRGLVVVSGSLVRVGPLTQVRRGTSVSSSAGRHRTCQRKILETIIAKYYKKPLTRNTLSTL